MVKRKGQAAIEFLMTYSWALLVIGAVIAAFVYVQVSPRDYINPECNFNDGLDCLAHSITTTDLNLEVKNVVGKSIEINRLICTIDQTEYTNNAPHTINPGESKVITCDSLTNMPDNNLVRANVVIYYTVDGYDFPRTTEGNVIGYVSS